jgi:hypothetical protein
MRSVGLIRPETSLTTTIETSLTWAQAVEAAADIRRFTHGPLVERWRIMRLAKALYDAAHPPDHE